MPVTQGYSRTQIALHWAIAVLVIPQYVFGDAIAHAFGAWMAQEAVPFNPVVAFHVMTGMAIMLLMLWRIVLRFKRGAPAPVETSNPKMTKLATIVQHTMYLVLILMPLSGSLAWFGALGPAAGAHNVLKVVLLVLILLHVAGALKQQFVEKNNLIARMMKAG